MENESASRTAVRGSSLASEVSFLPALPMLPGFASYKKRYKLTALVATVETTL